MIQTRLKGMGVALITPFKEDESVDYDAAGPYQRKEKAYWLYPSLS